MALDQLNSAQSDAALHGLVAEDPRPLLIIAGAGSGKTNTLAHRVAQLVLHGVNPQRILLLTFTRRAAAEMTRRAQRIARTAQLPWSGTFHSIANRLLRLHAHSVGLDPAFTVLDRSDATDLLDLQRHGLNLSSLDRRFPKKGTCLAIYSRVVNAQEPLEQTLKVHFPWCEAWAGELKTLFAAYVAEKQKHHLLDYDDLLLYWFHLMSEPSLAARVAERFDHVLVDEYQDTNALQASVLLRMKPSGCGLTVVGDDAQSIYAFRAANVANILDFPQAFTPPARVVTLEQNYRSSAPILDAANAVIAFAERRFTKNLFTDKKGGLKPRLVTASDEDSQVQYVVGRILEQREAGVALKEQAVLFRTAHHSDLLELELGKRNIPFVKFGGLKFLESAHVKDLLCVLRWSENLRDTVAAFRVLQLLPGVGPAIADRIGKRLDEAGYALSALSTFSPPGAAQNDFASLIALVSRLRDEQTLWQGQLGSVRHWYQPHLERLYDHPIERGGDLEQLEHIADGYPTRERFLSEITLDPPQATGELAGPPHLDEDYLILSTIHSAKGQEWDSVYLINAADGALPSDLSTGSVAELEEERRLLYVAMTRARSSLDVVHPQKFFVRQQARHGDTHVFAPRTRFIPASLNDKFDCRGFSEPVHADGSQRPGAGPTVDVASKLKAMWG